MPIALETPITVPPVEAKSADLLWILGMHVDASQRGQPIRTTFDVAPYIGSTGEVISEQKQTIVVSDTFAACASNPTLAHALGSIYAAVEVLCKERSLFGLQPDPIIPSITMDLPATWTTVGGISLGTFTLTIDATGRPLNYQWRKNGTNITGANSAILVNTLSDGELSASFDVTIFNSVGNVTSSACLVSLPAVAPSLTQDLPATASLEKGNSLELTIGVAGHPLAYQWRKNGVNIDGETQSSYTVTFDPLEEEASFDVVISNEEGSITSTTCVVHLPYVIPTISVDLPPTATIDEGETLTLEVTAQGYPLNYRWSKNGIEIDGETNSSLVVSLSEGELEATFRVFIWNDIGDINSSDCMVSLSNPPISEDP